MAHHPQHQHGAGNSAEYRVTLERMNRFQEPEVRQAIADLQLPLRSYGLDVGCGVGLYALWLAAASHRGGCWAWSPEPSAWLWPSVRWVTAGQPGGWSSGRGTARHCPCRISPVIGCGAAMS